MTDTRSDRRREPVSFSVIETVGEATDRSAEELPRLADAVDPDALNALFDPARTTRAGGVRLAFRFAGCRVRVGGDGTVSAATNGSVAETGGGSPDREERLSDEEEQSATTDSA